ncbi:MAG: GNAT family N-acetyltransferase [Spirochaetes bacterium]|nr:GNAT family N-acetyltransferase [Spirochaetota bacterium]
MPEIRFVELNDLSTQEKFKKQQAYCFANSHIWLDYVFPVTEPGCQIIGMFEGETLLAGMFVKEFQCHLWGKLVKMAGIGNVTSSPEGRNQGFISDLFSAAFQYMKENKFAISILYPFKYTFYERLGYGNIGGKTQYQFTPHDLDSFSTTGKLKPNDGSPEMIDHIAEIDETWIKNYTFGILPLKKSIERNQQFLKIFDQNLYLAYNENHQPIGYIYYHLNRSQSFSSKLEITRMAWKTPDGFLSLLKFIKSHRDQCSQVEWNTSPAIPFSCFMKEKRPMIQINNNWMARPLNLREILELKLQNNNNKGKIVFSVQDPQIFENSGTYTIENGKVIKVPFKDINVIPFSLFSSLLFGYLSLDEALTHGLIKGEYEQDAKNFFTKDYSIYVTENF